MLVRYPPNGDRLTRARIISSRSFLFTSHMQQSAAATMSAVTHQLYLLNAAFGVLEAAGIESCHHPQR